MKRPKYLVSALCGVLIAGGLSGCGMTAAQGGAVLTAGGSSPQESQESTAVLSAVCGGGAYAETADKERFKPYEQFGLAYNPDKNELQYNGRLVRWFEDYYTIPDAGQAGTDFFNENGAVDVYAVRDLSSFVRASDGSFDPSGKLVGLKEFSAEEFAARDVEALKNPPRQITATTEGEISAEELENWLKEYAAFGISYDTKDDQWYLDGEKVRFCRDVLMSNGESLTGGRFKGALRTFESRNGGVIDIYTVRDFTNLNTNGYGTLTGIEKYSQKEFEEHTQSGKEVQTSSGECTVIQQ